jgi:hypothetical protein
MSFVQIGYFRDMKYMQCQEDTVFVTSGHDVYPRTLRIYGFVHSPLDSLQPGIKCWTTTAPARQLLVHHCSSKDNTVDWGILSLRERGSRPADPPADPIE